MSLNFKRKNIFLCVVLLHIFLMGGCQPLSDIIITRIPTGEVHFPVGSTLMATEKNTVGTAYQPKESTPVLPNQTNLPCLSASAGIPFDITVPDGTRLYPGETFTKTWRIVNSGSCEWTSDFSVIWFSGDKLSEVSEKKINTIVAGGKMIDISIEMNAPIKPGVYKSYWKLRDSRGKIFGIGPQGDSAFWVNIEVVEIATPSPTVTLTPTPTEIIYKKGQVDLAIGDILDLDTGSINPETGGDITLTKTVDNRMELVLINGHKFYKVISKPIGIHVCLPNQPDSEKKITLTEGMDFSSAYCIITDKSLPGYISINNLDLVGDMVYLEYTIWAIP